MTEIERVVIIHGMNSDPSRHWFPSLTRRLEAEGVEVVAPTLPDSSEPDSDVWAEILDARVGVVDGSTVVVTHSLGTPAALQFLGRHAEPWRLAALVTVGGFSETLPDRDVTEPFTRGVDLDTVLRSAAVRAAFISDDDPVVPHALSARLAERLDASVTTVAGAGHFRDSDGVTLLPELEDLVLTLVTTSKSVSGKASS